MGDISTITAAMERKRIMLLEQIHKGGQAGLAMEGKIEKGHERFGKRRTGIKKESNMEHSWGKRHWIHGSYKMAENHRPEDKGRTLCCGGMENSVRCRARCRQEEGTGV